MRRASMAVVGLVSFLACASPPGEPVGGVPPCAPLVSLQPLPASCEPGELDEFSNALSHEVLPRASSALVRVELDEASRVRAVCVEEGPGYGAGSARRALAEHLDAILALPPGPACAAGRRLDLNRYEAALAKVRDRETRCGEQTRITRETHGNTTVRDRTVPGAYGVYDREYERCLELDADWIALEARGSTRPWIYVKPEVPNPPGPPAYDTASRCFRKSRVFDQRAACIESEGWERLEPPPR